MGYSLPETDNARIDTQVRWFAKHPEYIERVSLRGQLYLFHIVEELEARNMPTELALLPIVESAFDPFAYSPGRASGMWQIIPGTGKMLGLKQTWWYDGRRDITASTDAALDYLEKLHARFDGDWYLALAAYNSGAGTVNRAIRKNRKAGKPTDYWSLPLPKETRGYVPRLLALSKLFLEPEQYGLTLPSVANEPHFVAVDVGAQIDLAQAAELAGLSMDELYKLNPGFNRWATDPEGPHLLLVPIESADRFLSGLESIPPEERVTWQRHTIKQGETLSHIARQYKVSVSTLQSINNLHGSSIRAGRTLMVPVAAKGEGFYSLSAEQRLTQKQNAGQRNNRQRIDYTVRSGDSLWSISRRYDVSSGALAKWNAMAPGDTLRVGQKLVIWQDNASLTAGERDDSIVRKLHYRVRQGDSLYRIASRFSVDVNDIKKWNQLEQQRYLQPGQKLVLFVDVKDT